MEKGGGVPEVVGPRVSGARRDPRAHGWHLADDGGQTAADGARQQDVLQLAEFQLFFVLSTTEKKNGFRASVSENRIRCLSFQKNKQCEKIS